MNHHDTNTPYGRDPRLGYSLGAAAWRLATVDEHAQAAGMAVDEMLDQLAGHLEGGWVAVEASDGVLFLNTAPGSVEVPGVSPNMWAAWRATLDVADAAQLWRNVRALEAGGWRVEMRPKVVAHRFGRFSPQPWATVDVQERAVPLVWLPGYSSLAGLCDTYAAAGEPIVAVTCAPGGLDETVAGVRSWVLTRGAVAGGRWLSVLVLEEPSFTATLLRCTDNSVTPVTFARSDRSLG